MRINKTDRGVAGLTILLSVIVMLFVIGLLVMVFSLMGGELRDATYTSTDASATNESGFYLNGTTFIVDNAGKQDFSAFVVTSAHNFTDGAIIGVGNITSGATGTIVNATSTWNPAFQVNISYTYTYNAENTATQVMNDTTAGISSVTDWFNIFIVITAMVVLILLVVIIITAIRGSGMLQGGA